jgi:hypothetical protein
MIIKGSCGFHNPTYLLAKMLCNKHSSISQPVSLHGVKGYYWLFHCINAKLVIYSSLFTLMFSELKGVIVVYFIKLNNQYVRFWTWRATVVLSHSAAIANINLLSVHHKGLISSSFLFGSAYFMAFLSTVNCETAVSLIWSRLVKWSLTSIIYYHLQVIKCKCGSVLLWLC